MVRKYLALLGGTLWDLCRLRHLASGPRTAHSRGLACRLLPSFPHQARLVVFLDLDIDLLPHDPTAGAKLFARPLASSTPPAMVAEMAADWLSLLSCVGARNESLFTAGDHSAPINTGLMLLKPSMSLYRAGLAVLRRASFNRSHGWGLVGRPSQVVPPNDDAWRVRPGGLRMLDRDSWDFVHGGLDQGLFYHMFRVQRRLGADLRLVCSHLKPRSASTLKAFRRAARPLVVTALSLL